MKYGKSFYLPRPFQNVRQVVDRLVALLVREFQDILQGEGELGDVGRDVVLLLLRILDPLLLADMDAETPAALLQGEFHLLDDLRVRGDRLLGLRGEGNPDRGDVQGDGEGADRQGTSAQGEALRSPVRLDHGLGDRAGR